MPVTSVSIFRTGCFFPVNPGKFMFKLLDFGLTGNYSSCLIAEIFSAYIAMPVFDISLVYTSRLNTYIMC